MNTLSMTRGQKLIATLIAMLVMFLLAGCPPIDYIPGGTDATGDYAAGLAEGFLKDDYYWDGYWDSRDTVDAGPIYYDTSGIPYIEEETYDAGYWDGVWYAYNDGYFVAYDYAFTIGFSEGYDMAYREDWFEFLLGDEHLEYLDGGFSDGYNDGFSEGRIWGAADWELGLVPDWIDALYVYRQGDDAYLEDLELGTGEYGPVTLYEYGYDPSELAKSIRLARSERPGGVPSVRRNAAKAAEPELVYRPLTADAVSDLNQTPLTSPRGDRELTLTTSWLERLDAYYAADH